MANVTNLNDTLVQVEIHGNSVGEATTHLQKLLSLAHQIETEPCVIRTEHDNSDTETLHAQFDFCCAAEKIIFQLNCLFNSKYQH